MNQPKVSIIVPIYNVEKYLDRCVQSLMHQTLKDIEIILVDDGSPDNCPAMCDEYAKQDNRIKVVHKKNAGLGMARNSGIEVAMGEYIAFLDSDDYTETSAYETYYKYSENGRYDIVYAGYKIENLVTGKFDEREITNKRYDTKDEVLNVLALMLATPPNINDGQVMNMAVWRSIYKRSVIVDNKILFESERQILSEDIVFDSALLPYCNSIRFIPYAFTHYCMNEGSLSHVYSKTKVTRIETMYQHIVRNIGKNTEFSSLFQERTLRLFYQYYEVFLEDTFNTKEIDTKEKRTIYHAVLRKPEWKDFYKTYPIDKLSIIHRLKLKTICSDHFQLAALSYRILNLLRKIKKL